MSQQKIPDGPVFADAYSALCVDIAAQMAVQRERLNRIIALEGDGGTVSNKISADIDGVLNWLQFVAQRHVERIALGQSVVKDINTDASRRIMAEVMSRQTS